MMTSIETRAAPPAARLPQLVCVVDGEGRVLRANRGAVSWLAEKVDAVRDRTLDELLHGSCADPDCYLRPFAARAGAALRRGQRMGCAVSDAALGRRIEIRAVPAGTGARADGREVGFVVVDDTGGAAREEPVADAAGCDANRLPPTIEDLIRWL